MQKSKHFKMLYNKIKMHGHCTLKLITEKYLYLSKKNTTPTSPTVAYMPAFDDYCLTRTEENLHN